MIRYFEQQLVEFRHALQSLDEGEFNRLVKEAQTVLEGGHKIIVSGLGKNVPICEKIVGSLRSLGLDACFLHTNSAVHGDMGMVKRDDLLILLTKSGETQESIYLARLLKERGVNLWLLTFSKDSTLTREIPNFIVLDLVHEGDPWNIMPNNSSTVNLIVLQGLVMRLAVQMGIELTQFKRNHPGGYIGETLKDL